MEFLDSINIGKQLTGDSIIRLYDFDEVEAQKFQDAIKKIASGKEQELKLDTLGFIDNLNCNLVLRISNPDIGINTTDKIFFSCDLSNEKYSEMVELLEPFCSNDSDGFQWLYNLDVPIDFLFSKNGKW